MLILLSACLLSQPTQCHDDQIPMSYQGTNPFICLRHAQSVLAEWQAAHPELHVAKWRCAVRGTVPRDL
ncbi:hypothetical protein AFCDBAGC_1408 [Methylobacterium cerastii]|uniref:Uncharacterized protein n=1 Tax=Methylobacterium cerastii TaxID=932741 RepID=A0ABQ4QEL6_9HYPH|nr:MULTISPECIES: hypothetical protein [Methylobacterium]TXM89338.1 hypothetical protein FV219_23390 [Methylobacterium sp. WL122]TXM69358.1 hypothetical protein FV229_05435 [Methylobacterium sp. WL120]TXM71630.1 hypothetical protein FV226_14685 [Methylobacterium sp. WL12]TXM96686.1 hypothetical protein FV222_17565 [Methylobacterium sp. WL103]GJD43556.1 hypothetical protein AFCDBAGC_1408 [Methylobacterium cerastii]